MEEQYDSEHELIVGKLFNKINRLMNKWRRGREWGLGAGWGGGEKERGEEGGEKRGEDLKTMQNLQEFGLERGKKDYVLDGQ